MVDIATGAAVANDDTVSTVVPLSLTKDEGACVDVSVVFEGACVGAFVGSAGQCGEGNNNVVESAASKVGHKDRGPHRFDRRGQGNRRSHYRSCRCCCCRHLPQSGGRGLGSGGAVLDPAAERASLNRCAIPLRPLCGTRPIISPSLSSRLCPPHYLPLPPPALADC